MVISRLRPLSWGRGIQVPYACHHCAQRRATTFFRHGPFEVYLCETCYQYQLEEYGVDPLAAIRQT
jgi:protein-arginine kinase activator protein McsA